MRSSYRDRAQALKTQLKAGIVVVSAPQLFPTPPELAQMMGDMLAYIPGMRVLEPSAGTGRLLDAIPYVKDLTAIEYSSSLHEALKRTHTWPLHLCMDFLEYDGSGGWIDGVGTRSDFDRIIMNPPFKDGADIKHIMHAYSLLADGGRIVALCANGPRQQKALKPMANHWRELPAGSFASEGTAVNVALLVIDK